MMELVIPAVVTVGALALSVKEVPQTTRGVKERFGKFNCYMEPGLNFKIPFVERIVLVNITEQLVDAEQQEVITKDNLNARVDAQVYFKVRSDADSIKRAFYNVNDVEQQIVALARTSLRNVIGTMDFVDVNSQRDKINSELYKILATETKNWGIEIVRTELKEITPPNDVQETMNKVLKAQNEKRAAIDFATAKETEADGFRRAEIKKADGEKQAMVLRAQGEAQATINVAEANAKKYKLESESLQRYFKKAAVEFKRLETTQIAMANGSKWIVPNKDITLVVSEASGITPVKGGK